MTNSRISDNNPLLYLLAFVANICRCAMPLTFRGFVNTYWLLPRVDCRSLVWAGRVNSVAKAERCVPAWPSVGLK